MTTRFGDHFPSGDHASRPAAGVVPKWSLYSCSEHSLVYQTDGSTWSVWYDPSASTVLSLFENAGDLLVGTGPAAAAVLPIGSNGDVLTVVAGDLAYAPPGAVDAADVTFTPTGGLAATDVQAALAELDTEKQPIDADLTAVAALSSPASLITGAVQKSLFDANTILAATSDDTPAALTVDASRIVGRKASGDIAAMTAAELWALLAAGAGHPEVLMIALSDETTAITTGNAKLTMRMPFAFTLTAVRASLTTASSSGTPTVDINENGSTILSTKLTIDASELTSTTAAAAAVISDANLADDAEITFDIDVAGTGAKGLKVYLIGTRA